MQRLSAVRRGAMALIPVLAWSAGPVCAQISCTGSIQSVFTVTGAAQQFVVPPLVTGVLVEASGAAGGPGNGGVAGGKGARLVAQFAVVPGEMLNVVVGGMGGGNGRVGGGGGGSFVYRTADAGGLILAAAGGGGAADGTAGSPGSATPTAADGIGTGLDTGGTAGVGGHGGGGGAAGGGGGDQTGAGGGGLLTDGGNGNTATTGGKALANGAVGGGGAGASGGFGGGGGAADGGGGGGGGYNGGGGGAGSAGASGGGGGSFFNANALGILLLQSGVQAGDGQVSICYTPATILGVGEGRGPFFTRGDIGDQYFIFAENGGSESTTASVTVTDTLPAGLVATGFGGPGWTNCTATPVVGPGTLSCQLANALGGDGSTANLTLTVDVAIDAPAVVTNIVQIAGGGGTILGDGTIVDPTPVKAAPIATVPALSDSGLAVLAALMSGFGVFLIASRRRRASTVL